jgi:hypothetical protein
MIWHTEIVPCTALERLLATIRASAGTIVSCRPTDDQVQVTWMGQG